MIKKFTIRILSIITLSIINNIINIPISQADSQTQLTSIQFEPPPPPSRGAPGNRGEGASRGDCARSDIPLTALVPSFNSPITNSSSTNKNVWGLTTDERPTFWVYVPFVKTCSTIEFVLQNEQGKSQYTMFVDSPDKPSIISIQLPTTAPVLNPNQIYHWFIQIKVAPKQADDSDQLADFFGVNGWIKRTNPDTQLSTQLQQVAPLQQARLYAKNGFWFDALTTLAVQRLTKTQDWKNLLHSVQLDDLAIQPIVTGTLNKTTQKGN